MIITHTVYGIMSAIIVALSSHWGSCVITITVTVIVIMPSLHHAQQADWYNNHK
jgi:hypothetical protein